MKQRVIRGDNFSKPWFHKGLKNACAKKNQLYKNYLKYRTTESCERYKNKLVSILRASEKMYYNGLLVTNRNKMKETWKILNQVIKKNQSSENIENLNFKEGSKTYSSEKAKANGFNKFFVSIGPNLADNITSHSNRK